MIGYAVAGVVLFLVWIGAMTFAALGVGKVIGLRNRRG